MPASRCVCNTTRLLPGCTYHVCAKCCRAEPREPACSKHLPIGHPPVNRRARRRDDSEEADLGEHIAEEKEAPTVVAPERSAPAVNPAVPVPAESEQMLLMLQSIIQPITARLAALETGPANPAVADAKSAPPAPEAKEIVDVTHDNTFFNNFAQVGNKGPPAASLAEDVIVDDIARPAKAKKKKKNKQVTFSSFASRDTAASELGSDLSEDSEDECRTGGTITDRVRDEVKRFVKDHGTLIAFVRAQNFESARNGHECLYLARLWPLMRDPDQQEFVARRFVGLLCAEGTGNFNAMTAFFGSDDLTLSRSLLSNLVKHTNALTKYQQTHKEYAAPSNSSTKKPHRRNNKGKRGGASGK